MNNYFKNLEYTLNGLLRLNKDEQKRFEQAAEITDNRKLKNYFLNKAKRRENSASEIKSQIVKYGGIPTAKGSLMGVFHRGVMDLKSFWSMYNDDSLFEKTVKEERAMLNEYQKLIQLNNIPISCHEILKRQILEIKFGLNIVTSIEDLD
tara:strand:- start:1483 stop:1932 length:450 start_codon:yes stop_codon:yes gene_type:complete